MAEPSIMGLKKGEYTSATEVLGQDVRLEELPEGIRFYIKGQKINFASKEIVVKLYEMIREPGGLKMRMEHLETFQNRIPEEDEVALKYGPSLEGYKWIAKWLDQTGTEERGIESATIKVSEHWRDRYETARRKRKKDAEAAALGPVAALPAAAGVGGGIGVLEVLAFIREGRESALRDMERMAAVMKSTQHETPAAVMEKAWESVGKVMEKVMDSQLSTVKKVGEKTIKALEREDPDDGFEPEDEEEAAATGPGPSSGMPAWLEPFMPKIQEYLGSLLGGGPVGAAVKTVILSTKEWQEVFADPAKFGEAQQAMINQFGEDKTKLALDILLNRRADKPGRKARK